MGGEEPLASINVKAICSYLAAAKQGCLGLITQSPERLPSIHSYRLHKTFPQLTCSIFVRGPPPDVRLCWAAAPWGLTPWSACCCCCCCFCCCCCCCNWRREEDEEVAVMAPD